MYKIEIYFFVKIKIILIREDFLKLMFEAYKHLWISC